MSRLCVHGVFTVCCLPGSFIFHFLFLPQNSVIGARLSCSFFFSSFALNLREITQSIQPYEKKKKQSIEFCVYARNCQIFVIYQWNDVEFFFFFWSVYKDSTMFSVMALSNQSITQKQQRYSATLHCFRNRISQNVCDNKAFCNSNQFGFVFFLANNLAKSTNLQVMTFFFSIIQKNLYRNRVSSKKK